jgi:hypothetical protein
MRTTLMTTAACLVCLATASLAEANLIPFHAVSTADETSFGQTLTQTLTSSVYSNPTMMSVVDTSTYDNWGGTASVVAGTLVNGQSATMAWRTRTAGETWGTETAPPMPVAGIALASDVVQLGGPNGAFVLEMGYHEDPTVAQTAYNEGLFYLGWMPNPGTSSSQWQNANTLGTKGADAIGQDTTNESFASFASREGITAANLNLYAGDWGVDIADGNAWCILNANLTAGGMGAQQFAVVPEPGTMTLLGSGGLGLALWGIKRRRAGRTTRSQERQEVGHALCA